MNHCILEVTVIKDPTIRYTQDNKTAIAEMDVLFDGLRPDDPNGEIKIVGWGNMAQELQTKVKAGQTLLAEGRLRMSTVPRQDGTKEKKAELTLSKIHHFNKDSNGLSIESKYEIKKDAESSNKDGGAQKSSNNVDTGNNQADWNSAPLIPDTDEIPF